MKDLNAQIRKRQSYGVWQGVSKFLDGKPTKREIMMRMHQLLDGSSAYGSITKSDYSRESLELVLKDEAAAETIKVGDSRSGDELMEAIGGDMHDGLYALGNDETIVVAEDEGNDNYKVVAVLRR